MKKPVCKPQLLRCDDLDTAKLNLSILKENSEYIEFFSKLKSDPHSIPQLKKDDESENEFHARILMLAEKKNSFENKDAGDIIDCICWFVFGIQRSFSISDILNLLDPKKDLKVVPSGLIEKLPLIFQEPGLRELPRTTDKLVMFGLNKKDCVQLQPYERMLLIDLRKRKTQIIEEFKAYIDSELKGAEVIKQNKEVLSRNSKILSQLGYDQWELYVSRQKTKARKQLEVWKLRKKRISFSNISIKFKITEDLARKRFYRAFEITQGEQYHKGIWQKLIKEIIKREIKDPSGKFNKKAFEEYSRMEETKQQDLLIGSSDPHDRRKGQNDSQRKAQPKYTSLFPDIEKKCNGCTDTGCYKNMRRAIGQASYKSWHPCPVLITFLKNYK